MVIFKKIKTMKNLGNVISTSKGRMTKEKAQESCERSQNESQALVPVTCTLK